MRWAGWVAVWLVWGFGQLLFAETSERSLTFERDIRPILKANCFHCHGEGDDGLEGSLDLRLRRLIAKGGDSGPAIVPGDPQHSLLVQRVRDGEMPPGEKSRKLTPDELALLERWIASGANTAGLEPAEAGTGLLITDEDRNFWSFQPIRRPAVPAVKHADRVRTPVDTFLLARLEQEGFSFSAEADRATLIRRASFDLLGLPPSPEEVARFVADESPDAYERLIDELLASPHYGERWGRHWLDVAGYADSEGYVSEDPVREWAWKYRDYVIQSFNADKPFDQLVVEQLAGDELLMPPYKNLQSDQIEKLVATGFLRMAPDGTGAGADNENLARNETIAETIKIVSTSLLGLTVGCAQCHNHRYDPISQVDYYQLRAIFEPAYDVQHWRTPKQRLVSLYTDEDRQKAKEIETEAAEIDKQRLAKQAESIERTFEKELAKLPEEIRETVRTARNTPDKERTAEQKKLLKEHPSVNVSAGSLYLYDSAAANELKKMTEQAAQVRARKPKEEFVHALTEVPGQVPATHLFYRGDFEQPKQAVVPSGLTILANVRGPAELPVDDPAVPTTGRRLAFSRRLTDGTHPLTARVLVNRVWLHHFGRGLVATPGDFGFLGDRPSHPELLDWLAREFMDSGWSVKRLHKLLMTSTAYRQALRNNADLERADPDNRLLGGASLRRLEAEAIRDAILTASGQFNDKPYGPAVPVMADSVGQFVIGIENLNAGRPGEVIPLHGEEFRRSVFVQVRRSRPLAVLDTFDAPLMEPNCELRSSSTVTPQALMLMNSEFIVDQSKQFAQRVIQEVGSDPQMQAERAWTLAYSRPPTDTERHEAVAFLNEQTTHFRDHSPKPAKDDKRATPPADPAVQALATFCQVLLSGNRFLYVD